MSQYNVAFMGFASEDGNVKFKELARVGASKEARLGAKTLPGRTLLPLLTEPAVKIRWG